MGEVRRLFDAIVSTYPESRPAKAILAGGAPGGVVIATLPLFNTAAEAGKDMSDPVVAQIEAEAENLGNATSPAQAFQSSVKLVEVFDQLDTLTPALRDQAIEQAFAVDKWTGVLAAETVDAIKLRALEAEISAYSVVGVWVLDAFLETYGEAWLRDATQGSPWTEYLVSGSGYYYLHLDHTTLDPLMYTFNVSVYGGQPSGLPAKRWR